MIHWIYVFENKKFDESYGLKYIVDSHIIFFRMMKQRRQDFHLQTRDRNDYFLSTAHKCVDQLEIDFTWGKKAYKVINCFEMFWVTFKSLS